MKPIDHIAKYKGGIMTHFPMDEECFTLREVLHLIETYHEQQVKSVDLAEVGGSLLDEIVSALKKKQRGYEISKVWPASEAYKDAIGIVNSKKQ